MVNLMTEGIQQPHEHGSCAARALLFATAEGAGSTGWDAASEQLAQRAQRRSLAADPRVLLVQLASD